MKAYLRSARIAPKKANIIASMVRGMPVEAALDALERTNKKGARLVEKLVKSAMANAVHNDKQTASMLFIKTIVVNQGLGYQRGVPMARGRMRPMTKFLSHISVQLGVNGEDDSEQSSGKKKKSSVSSTQSTEKKAGGAKKSASSQKTPAATKKSTPSESPESSASSASSAS